MMKKRISILTLILLFLVSTTGMPVTYHLCLMMQEKSLNECDVCKVELERIETSCCAEETMANPSTISSENPVCCHDEFVYNKVEDEFVANKSEVNFFSLSEKSIPIVSVIPPSVNFILEKSFYCDSSPPFLINPELHIFNSVFLI